MTASTTYAFDPTLATIVDEAAERAGMDPATLTLRHLVSIRRSLDLLFKDWQNRGIRNYAVDLQTATTTVGMASFTPATGTQDLLEVSLRRDSVDTPMTRISRSDFEAIPDKTTQGRPDRYYVDRSTTAILVYVWPLGDNTTDTIRYWRMRKQLDSGVASNTADIPDRFQEAIAAGLAYKLAEKFAPDRYDALRARAEDAFKMARQEDREKAPVTLSVRYK